MFKIVAVDRGMRHRHQRFVGVIEDHHLVVQGKRKVGQFAIILRGVRQPLDIAHRVVAGVAHRASAKPGQARDVRRVIRLEQFFEFQQRIGRVEFLDPALGIGEHDMAVKRLDVSKRLAAHKAVATVTFPADDAFEQKRPRLILELPKHMDGRERVVEQSPIDRDNRGARGELAEFFERGVIPQALLLGLAHVLAGHAGCGQGLWQSETRRDSTEDITG